MPTGLFHTPSVSVICSVTRYTADCTFYMQTCKDERGFFISVNGYHIRPPVEEQIDTRHKALQWMLELYRL